jgi:hypothetical protein
MKGDEQHNRKLSWSILALASRIQNENLEQSRKEELNLKQVKDFEETLLTQMKNQNQVGFLVKTKKTLKDNYFYFITDFWESLD